MQRKWGALMTWDQKLNQQVIEMKKFAFTLKPVSSLHIVIILYTKAAFIVASIACDSFVRLFLPWRAAPNQECFHHRHAKECWILKRVHALSPWNAWQINKKLKEPLLQRIAVAKGIVDVLFVMKPLNLEFRREVQSILGVGLLYSYFIFILYFFEFLFSRGWCSC
jgi:hypothetical protein